MSVLFTILFFCLGAIMGSFYNVVGLRLPKDESFIAINDRSYCPNCHKPLRWYELIPIFSYLLQAGKCRKCKSNVSPIYPIGEMMTGLLFAFSYVHFGLEWELVIALLFISMLMIVFVSDMTYMVIPNKVLLFFIPFFIIMRIVQPLDPWWSPIVGSVLGFGIIFLIIVISRGGMGAGDMKLFAVLGLVLGAKKVLLTFFLASFIGAIIGMVLMYFKIIKKKQPIPFGPFIILAALITFFFGEPLLHWYLNFI